MVVVGTPGGGGGEGAVQKYKSQGPGRARLNSFISSVFNVNNYDIVRLIMKHVNNVYTCTCNCMSQSYTHRSHQLTDLYQEFISPTSRGMKLLSTYNMNGSFTE